MHIAIVGFGIEGQSAYRYFTKHGHEVTICDYDTTIAVPADASAQLGDLYLHDLNRFDRIIRSAGIHPNIILDVNPDVTKKITTVVNEFLRVCPTPNVIGITGTKGKGTTSTLTSLMLGAAGKTVHLAGNIGRSPLDFVDEVQIDDWIVLELSSFQLSDVTHSPHIAVCLMMVPEHLNWHADMADYVHAKSNLFRWQESDDISIYYAENAVSQEIASNGNGVMLPYYAKPGAYVDGNNIVMDGHTICRTDELKLLGKHNWQNVCAAITAAWQVTQDTHAMRSVITSFTGLEHRLEKVRELDGILYYDDSFATIPETTIVAVEAFEQPKVLILGGSVKGSTYDQLARTIAASNVRQVILIGNPSHTMSESASPLIEAALRNAGYESITSLVKPGGASMQEIVQSAQQAAQPGDVLLLSTGCASFDMFRDYKDRGNQFQQVVASL